MDDTTITADTNAANLEDVYRRKKYYDTNDIKYWVKNLNPRAADVNVGAQVFNLRREVSQTYHSFLKRLGVLQAIKIMEVRLMEGSICKLRLFKQAAGRWG